jgi:hypothetical protein
VEVCGDDGSKKKSEELKISLRHGFGLEVVPVVGLPLVA